MSDTFKLPEVYTLIEEDTLEEEKVDEVIKDKDLQLLMFTKRMQFIQPDGRPNKKITFSCSYYCWNLLPKQIIIEDLNIDGGIGTLNEFVS